MLKNSRKITKGVNYICILTDLLINGNSGSIPFRHWKIEKIKIDSVNTNTIEPNSAIGKMRKR